MAEESRILHEPTVLVLGAGASKPHGFPLGVELKNAILDTNSNLVLDALRHKYDDDIVEDFRKALKYTEHSTIDSFLEAKTTFREIGAYFIAGTIGRLEMEESLFPRGDWYADLIMALCLEDERRDAFPVSIVTLNYDRSLEHFLTKHIDYNCRHDLVERAHEKRLSVPIIHVHGSLGAYPQVAYGRAVDDTAALGNAAGGIRIVSDRLEESPDFRKAQQALSVAKHIIFLGFGYDERTLRLLLQDVDQDTAQFCGTAFQQSSLGMDHIRGLFKNRVTLGDNSVGCNGFLQRIGMVAKRSS